MRGQTRDDLCLIASSVSVLTVLMSSLVPAFLLNSDSERCDVAFQSASAGAVRQPTRRSSAWTDLVRSACDVPASRDATLVVLSGPGAAGGVAGADGVVVATAAATRLRSASAA